MGRILPFRPRRTLPPARISSAREDTDRSPVQDLEKFEHSGEEDDYRHRMIVNVVAFVIAVLLILSGVWLATTMAQMRKNQDCVLSGRRGCTPVEAPPATRF
jgi:hypothetical protein